MAVYTHVSEGDVAEFLARYDIGELESCKGIAEGVSNTNYLLTVIPSEAEGSFLGAATQDPSTTPATSAGSGRDDKEKYILTLFEKSTKLEDLPYFTALMQWWNARGISCPQPVAMKDGRTLSALAERPALLVSFLEGTGVEKITLDHMPQLGNLIADMHITGMGFIHERENGLSLPAWENIIDANLERFDEIEPGLKHLVAEEYNYLSEHWPSELPRGPVHADLFPDNVFFTKEFGKKPVLSGVIDFYYACNDFWAYDLAIAINAWCFDERQRLVKERVQALMMSYNDRRPLTVEEDQVMPVLLRGAALRFLLTRSRDWLNPAEGAVITPKDPLEYLVKLQFFQNYKP